MLVIDQLKAINGDEENVLEKLIKALTRNSTKQNFHYCSTNFNPASCSAAGSGRQKNFILFSSSVYLYLNEIFGK